jgi:RNA polymerase sigma-70 factor (ECF subfamily)
MSAVAAPDDARLHRALLGGDEEAFRGLIERYHAPLVRLAMTYVRDPGVAEEVVQETWLGVLEGLERFERRSLLKTWIFRILTNKAKTRAVRERRSVPFSSLSPAADEGPSVEPERFLDSRHAVWPGHWASPPRSWDDVPERHLESAEVRGVIEAAIAELPPLQAQVISLRDVEGWSATEVCELLELSEVNQRVLLHRARSKVRAALERFLAEPSIR